MATHHINAGPSDFAPTVLMPGDPLRAQYIAEKFFEDARRVNDVRNMWGYTGTHRGKPISVMAHGMGMPSASIYCQELIESFGAQRIIRVGSCGTVHPSVKLRDILIAMGACTDSNMNRSAFGGFDFAPVASYPLLRAAADAAERRGLRFHVGNVFSSDVFYAPDPAMFDLMERYGVFGVEMESAAIYALAARFGVQALTLCTVSDLIRTGDGLSSKKRESSFDQMIELALDASLID